MDLKEIKDQLKEINEYIQENIDDFVQKKR